MNYDKLFEEVYNIEDIFTFAKLQTLIEEVSKMDLPKLHAHCKERLLHNQDLLYSIDVKDRVNKITEWLTR